MRKKGTIGLSAVVPALVGLIALLILSILTTNDVVEGLPSEFYEVRSLDLEVVQGAYLGTVSNGTFVTVGDHVNFTAENESQPSTAPTGDVLVLDINITDGSGSSAFNVSWPLKYTGSGKLFAGNMTLRTDLTSDYQFVADGIEINVINGYNITVRKHFVPEMIFYHFFVDAAAPSVSFIESGSSVTYYSGSYYASDTAVVNLSISDTDPEADYEWIVANGKATYRLDSGAWTQWDGLYIDLPSAKGVHSLSVNVTDRFDHTSRLTRTYNVATFITGDYAFRRTYWNETVFVSKLRIKDGGSLELKNCTVVLMQYNDWVQVEKGGAFDLKGPLSQTMKNLSVVTSSSGDPFSLRSEAGSTFKMDRTTIVAPSSSLQTAPVMDLKAGKITSSWIKGLKTKALISGTGVEVSGLSVEARAKDAGCVIDMNHSYGPKATTIEDLTIDGDCDIPLLAVNTSAWKPYDVTTVYHLGAGNHTLQMPLNLTGYADPYLLLPHFIDSRSADDGLYIWYYEGTDWRSLPGFPIKGNVYQEWANGDDAKIDLSPLPDLTLLKMTWNSSSNETGNMYLGIPKVGGSDKAEVYIDMSPFNIPLGTWDDDPVDHAALIMDGVNITDASTNFIKVASSGNVELSDLTLGSKNIISDSRCMVLVENGSASISESAIMGGSNAETAIYFDLEGNDWTQNWLLNMSIGRWSGKFDRALYASRCNVSGVNLTLMNHTIGVEGSEALFDLVKTYVYGGEYGAKMVLPSDYPAPASLRVIDYRTKANFTRSGLWIEGASVDYDIEITLSGMKIESFYNTTYTRESGYGGICLDLAGSGQANCRISGEVAANPGNGLSILDWTDNGKVMIYNAIFTNALNDGLYAAAPVTIEASVTRTQKSGGYGIYGSEGMELILKGLNLNSQAVASWNDEGGIKLADGSKAIFANVSIQGNGMWGLQVGKGSILSMNDTSVIENDKGIMVQEGASVNMFLVESSNNVLGQGLYAKDADLRITGLSYLSSTAKSKFVGNGDEGLLIDGGSLYLTWTDARSNTDDGLELRNVDLTYLNGVNSSENLGNGISVHIGDPSLLDPEGNYSPFKMIWCFANAGKGITFTYDPATISSTIEVEMRSVKAHSNEEGDIIAPKIFHLTWNWEDNDLLGTTGFSGKMKANIDINVIDKGHGDIRNMNITLLDNWKQISLGMNTKLTIWNSYIRPESPDHRFRISVDTMGELYINGGYLAYLYELTTVSKKVISPSSVNLDGVLVKYGEGALNLDGAAFTIENCHFSMIDGPAIYIKDGNRGVIRDTTFTDNLIGIQVDGLSWDLDISKSRFISNSWGIYLFNGSNKMVKINASSFQDNDPASIWVERGNVTVLDTTIDPSTIKVKERDFKVGISYTLSVEVLNEVGARTPFDITLKAGPAGGTILERTGIISISRPIETIYVVSPDTVNKDNMAISMTVRYVDYSEGTASVKAEYQEDLILDEKTHIAFDGFMKPRKTQYFDTKISALEDKGLINGPIDISSWFSDIGTDQGNLTFAGRQVDTWLFPTIEDGYLSVGNAKDMNGMGYIEIIVTDPHGKTLVCEVLIEVQPQNDPPRITDPAIRAKDSDSPSFPRTGDTIQATWTWYDIDANDPEPDSHIIRWYLNGTLLPDLNDQEEITGVMAGQVWNFTVIPADWYGLTYFTYGTPVSSPMVRVGNVAPLLSKVTLTPKSPTSDVDLLATPGSWTDPDSPVVTFNYLWEKKVSSTYVSIGAPNSPILSSSFTSKGDIIRVKAWVSDGTDISPVVSDTVTIRNSPPRITYAALRPEPLDETASIVYVSDIRSEDPDGDFVELVYYWYVGGIAVNVPDTQPHLLKAQGLWSYPLMGNVSVHISPFDNELQIGALYIVTIELVPTDSDQDGIPDDMDGNGLNDAGDDKDDDNDGYEDNWEITLGSNPKDPISQPLDTDGDRRPDGDGVNSQTWMDTDDDNDGIEDLAPDTYPKNPNLPGDMDYDGIGDDLDSDIDGDGHPNEDDHAPLDPYTWKEPEHPNQSLDVIIIIILVIVIIILLLFAAAGYLVYTGKVTLTSQGPPSVTESEGVEAIIDEERRKPKKREEEEYPELEDLEDLSVCSQCGELVSAELSECPNCGAMFEDEGEGDMEEFGEE